jgi:hypothetical protein
MFPSLSVEKTQILIENVVPSIRSGYMDKMTLPGGNLPNSISHLLLLASNINIRLGWKVSPKSVIGRHASLMDASKKPKMSN